MERAKTVKQFPKMRVGAVARKAEVSESLVRLYADQGLVPFELDSAGGRLFYEDAPERVRAARAARNPRRSVA